MFNYHTKLIERMIEQTPRAMVGVSLTTLVYIWIYLDYIPLLYLFTWALFQTIFIIFRIRNMNLLEKFIQAGDTEKIRQHSKYFFIALMISSFLWNISVIAGVVYAPYPYELLTLLMMVGIITGGVLSIASLYYMYIVYFFLMMIPHLLILLLYADGIHFAAAAFIIVYMPMILLLTKSIYNDQLENILMNESLQNSVNELHTLSITDSLTNIYNRRYFFDVAQNNITLSKRNKTPLTLLMIDIDYFKNVNDTYGHQAGDIVLISLTKKLKNSIRESDILARVGGEEFAILLYNTSHSDAKNIAEKLRQNVEDMHITYEDVVIPISVSIGIGKLDKDNTSIEALYKEADNNLYKAKENGRNRVN